MTNTFLSLRTRLIRLIQTEAGTTTPARLVLLRSHAQASALVLTIWLALLLDITGALHAYGLGALMGQRLSLAGALLLVVVSGGWLVVVAQATCAPSHPSGLAGAAIHQRRLVLLLLLLAWLATLANMALFLLPTVGPLSALVMGGGLLALALAVVWPPPTVWVLALAVGLGTFARLASFAHVPIHPSHSDMLPLVVGALKNVLAGHSPYTLYHMPWELPLTYLPVTWLAYLPPFLAGLDVRITNLLAELGVGGALLWLALVRSRQSAGGQSVRGREEIGLLLWGWFFLQPSTLNWSLSTTIPVLWALLSLLLVLVVAGRLGWAALVFGLCLAASPIAALVGPFVLLCWLWAAGWRRTLVLAATAAGVAALCIVPFWRWSPEQFLFGTWRWFNDNNLYPRLRWDMDNTWAVHVGFSGVFWRHGWVSLLKPMQAALVLALAGFYALWRAPAHLIAPLVAAAVLLFMVFNPVLWPYLYTPAMVAALVALVSLVPAHSSQTFEQEKLL
jgi:hypothetical protein